MTAQSIGIFTIEFPDPYTQPYYDDPSVTLGSNISFQYPITSDIQTLSTKNIGKGGNDPNGILYVPDLQSQACKDSEAEYVAANATRLRNLPVDANYFLIGIFPWYSGPCVLEYFKAARKSPTTAVLVYHPGMSAEMPPPLSDPSWYLGDGGSWKSDNKFPTYAIAPVSGGIIMQQLSEYSGNLTDVPHGEELATLFNPTDYVRLWATVNIEAGNTLPSLWVFLVIVLGILIAIVFFTSFFMHVIQRRRRRDLQQRVINGEVDLEAIGVKRLTVPREYLEKLPLYTYSTGPNITDHEKSKSQSPSQTQGQQPPSAPDAANIPNEGSLAFSQPTCPICLDDFELDVTQVRELPCRHIFHPDCVDTFLLSNSSLCPMCKHSVLPSGYCPAKITNVMVRRERMIRWLRARTEADRDPLATHDSLLAVSNRRFPRIFSSLGTQIGRTNLGRRVFAPSERTQPHSPDIEMAHPTQTQPPTQISSSAAGPEIIPAIPEPPQPAQSSSAVECAEPVPPQNRREWARQRALALLGNRQVPEANEDEETGPRWRRGVRKVFPGFR
ncbi:hypothetical protein CC78DRAFT_510788 [Lojkania enalia]|uniref:RING-type domain-containing protein n=1 Tax=Lojkania enalia TaxID=147567 RepID=A0A9P4N6E5_9PLEO|nr:hypothetical protein CC78DRAFT_510788 [Didymosphaeria enalia]